MKYLKKINELFTSKSEDKWVTSEDEIRDYFIGIIDLGCSISMNKFWINKDLSLFSRNEKPGYYPGFIIVTSNKFKGTDLEQKIKYLQEVLDSKNKLEHYYNKFQISNDNYNEYKFIFLDKNWESITWDEDLVYIEEFITKCNGFYLKFGSFSIKKINTGVNIQFNQPVSKVKSNINIDMIKSELNRKFPNHEFEITENTFKSTGLQKNILVNSIDITCKGKKKTTS